MFGDMGKVLMLVGGALFLLGLLLTLAGRLPGLGRLPGDFVFQRDNITVYFPLGSMILLSLLLTVLLNLLGRFLR